MLESIKGFATSNFSWVVEKYPELFSTVKENLSKADMKISYRTYVSLVIFISIISFFSSILISFIALSIIKVEILPRIFYSFFASFFISMATFLVFIFYPSQRAEKRKRSIEANLPFAITHMGAIAESGIPPYVVFRLISKFKEYGEISREMEKIVRNIDEFGVDPLTAVKEVANKTPSDAFRQILLGFITTIEAGGDVKIFLKSVGEEALFEWRMKREKFNQQLTTISEFYISILMTAPLFIISLFAVMNMIQPTLAGFGIFELMKLGIYILVPLINIGFLLFLSGVEVQV
jgi:flagellar protein FlaJ